MSFWSRLFNTTRDVASPWSDRSTLSHVTAAALFPGYDADLAPLTRSEAMAVPSVAAARHRIVGTISRLPLRATKQADGSPYTDAMGLITQPDPAEVQSHTLAKTLDDLLFDGVAYWAVTAAYTMPQSGNSPTLYRPMSVAHVPLQCVRVDQLGGPWIDPRFLEWLGRNRSPLLSVPGTERPWLLRFDNFHPGLLTFGNRPMRTAANLDRAVEKVAVNPVPAIEIHQKSGDPISTTEAKALVRDWEVARRTSGVGFTNESLEINTHGMAAEHLLINARNQQSVEIARLAGIPASAIDAAVPGTSLTYANLRDRVTDLVNFGLTPYAQAIEGRLSLSDCTPGGVAVRFDYRGLFPADEASPTPITAPAPAPTLENAP